MLGDCLERMKEIPDGSVDLILTDPPYGTTACKWDSVIPFEPMWEQLNRIVKPNGAIVLFGAEPFSSFLRMSNIKNYKYDWVWDKVGTGGFLNAKKRPLKRIEDICVFSNGVPVYYPIMEIRGKPRNKGSYNHKKATEIWFMENSTTRPLLTTNIIPLNYCVFQMLHKKIRFTQPKSL